ncbi:hypothetical protein HanXRQr2_Chr16g0774081 [Helianthus annuus]|uniref:Uncharacterized protein n=1 Tax=Helianthus annuus TaxID=4232 RepID=A0A251VA46_HELAN|nr:hypothetical protein HanXRQr2_Chr16g0774081 [Helianthus annuus]
MPRFCLDWWHMAPFWLDMVLTLVSIRISAIPWVPATLKEFRFTEMDLHVSRWFDFSILSLMSAMLV